MLANQGYGINSNADDERLVPDWAGQKRGGMLQKTMKAIGKVKISGKNKKKKAPMELMDSDSSLQYKNQSKGGETTDSDGEHMQNAEELDAIDDKAVDSDQPGTEIDSDKVIDGGSSDVGSGEGAQEVENGEQGTKCNFDRDDGETDNPDVFSSPESRRILVEEKVMDNAKKDAATPKTATVSIDADGAMQFGPSAPSLQVSMPETPSAYTPGQWKKRSLIPKMKGMKGLGSVIKMKNGIERNKKKSMQLMESVASMDYHVDEFQMRDRENSIPDDGNRLSHEDVEGNAVIPNGTAVETSMVALCENGDAPTSSRSLPSSSLDVYTLDEADTPNTPIVEKNVISGVMQFDPSGIATEHSFPQTPMANTASIANSANRDSTSSVTSSAPGGMKGGDEVSSEDPVSSQLGQEVTTKRDQLDGNGDKTLGRLSETIKTFGSGTAFDGYFSKIKDMKQQIEAADNAPKLSKEGVEDQANGKSSVLLTLTGSHDAPLSTTIQLELDEGMKLNALVASKGEKSQTNGEKVTADSLFKSPIKPSKMSRRSKHSGGKESRRSREGLQSGGTKVDSSKENTTQEISIHDKKSDASPSKSSSEALKSAKFSSSTHSHQDGTVSWNRVRTSKPRGASDAQEKPATSSGHSPKSRKSSSHTSDSPSRRLKRPALSGRKKSTGSDDDKGGVSWKRIESPKSRRSSAGQGQPDNTQSGAISPSRSSKRNTTSGHIVSNRPRRKKQPAEERTGDQASVATVHGVPEISPSLVGQPSTSLREIRRLVEASKGEREDLATLPLDLISHETPSTSSSQPRTPSNRRTSRRLQRIASRTETPGPSPSPRVNMARASSLRNFRYDKDAPGSSTAANPTQQRRGARPSESTTSKDVTGDCSHDRSSRDKTHGEPSEDPSLGNHRHRRSRNFSDVGASDNSRQRNHKKSSESSALPVAQNRRMFSRSESLRHFGRPSDGNGPVVSDIFGDSNVVDGPVGEEDAIDSAIPAQSQNPSEENKDASSEGDVSAAPFVSRRTRPSHKRNSRIVPENSGEIRSMDSPSGSRGSLRRQKARRKHSESSELKNAEETGNRASTTSIGDSRDIVNAGTPKDANLDSIQTQSSSPQPKGIALDSNQAQPSSSQQKTTARDSIQAQSSSTQQNAEGETEESRKSMHKHSGKKKHRQQLPDSETKLEKSKEANMDEQQTNGKAERKLDFSSESSAIGEKSEVVEAEQAEKTDTPEVEQAMEIIPQAPPASEKTDAVELKELPREVVEPRQVDTWSEPTGCPPTKAKAKPKRGPPRLSATLQLGALRKGHQHMDDQSVFSDAFGSVVGDGPGFKPDKQFPEIHTAEELCAPQLVFNPKENEEGVDVQVSIHEVGMD